MSTLGNTALLGYQLYAIGKEFPNAAAAQGGDRGYLRKPSKGVTATKKRGQQKIAQVSANVS